MRRTSVTHYAFAALTLGGCKSDQSYGHPEPDPAVSNPAELVDPVQSDRYVQVDKPMTDILYVVDNSSSMLDEQTGLTQNFPKFMQYFVGSGLDYHIGVVSTDMEDPNQSGKLIAADGVLWIDDQTPDPVGTFDKMASLGITGSHFEKGLDASYTALETRRDGANAGFLRDNSTVGLIIISDEEDQSTLIDMAEYQDWFENLRPQPDQRTFSSVVSPRPPEFPCAGASTPGERYLRLTEEIGGIEWSFCDPNWSAVLEQLGLQAAGLKREYFLSQLPIVSSIVVSVVTDGYNVEFEPYDPKKETGDWTYNPSRNSITFLEYVPDPLSEVVILYTPVGAAESQ